MRFGIRIARPKCCAVNGSVALSISPSRTCKCQSSGLRMVMRVVIGGTLLMRRGSPPPASEASGGEGLGLGGRRLLGADVVRAYRKFGASVVPPTPRSAASPRHPTRPANGREGHGAHGASVPSSIPCTRGTESRDAAEHSAGHQAGAARVVEIEDAADQLSRGVEAGDRVH